MKLVKSAKIAYIIASCLLIVLGVLLICMPQRIDVACYIVGAISIAFGVAKIIGYFSKDLFRLAFQFDLTLGLLAILLGIVIIAFHTTVGAFLPYIFGVYVIIDGIAKLETSVDAKRFGYKNWWVLVILSVLTGIAGVLIFVYPQASADVLLILLGIGLTLDGIENLYTVIYCVKVVKNIKQDIDELK